MKLAVIITALCMHIMSWTDNGYITYALNQTKQPFSLGFLAFLTMQTPSSGQRNNM